MHTIAETMPNVIVGVDTHKDVHVAAVINDRGRILDTLSVPTSKLGIKRLLKWSSSFGDVIAFGIEGTSSYGAGLCRFLLASDQKVVEVNRPNRQRRRRLGKSDTVDAESAARAVLADEGVGTPKSQDGNVEMVRMLRMARRSATKARAQTTNQMKHLLMTGPESLREQLSQLSTPKMVTAASKFRPGAINTAEAAAKFTIKTLAHRWLMLDAEIQDLDSKLENLIAKTAPDLVEIFGVGTDVAGAFLVAAGDNPERLHSEAAFAALCGASPVEASSGKTTRHRLNRGGDRVANNALWRVVMVRLSFDPRTRAYVLKRTQEGKSKKEIIRCLKRYVAREIYRALVIETTSNALAA